MQLCELQVSEMKIIFTVLAKIHKIYMSFLVFGAFLNHRKTSFSALGSENPHLHRTTDGWCLSAGVQQVDFSQNASL